MAASTRRVVASGQGMIRVSRVLCELWTDEEALTTVEYALLLVFIVIVAAASWDHLGQALVNSADEPIAVMENPSG